MALEVFEQDINANQQKKYTASTDVYSSPVVCAKILTGEKIPFDGYKMSIVHASPEIARVIDHASHGPPDYPKPFAVLIRRC